MGTRKLIVEVVGDSRSLEKSFARSTASSKQFESGVTGNLRKVDSAFTRTQKLFIGGFAGGIAAGATVRVLGQITGAASDLNEQITKSDQVFGRSASAVRSWSETTAKSLGISQTAALEAAGTFGNLFSAIGLSEGVAANTSRQLVQLASDLASFNNADPSDVLTALRSGIVGEIEPLRRFGVQLSAARVEQEALVETGKKSADSLTDQEKVLARVNLIMRDTTKAQGDFARTSEGLANQQRILKAQFEDLEAELGTKLLPIMVRGAEIANAFFDSLHPPATAIDLIGQDFRNKFADAFGMEALQDLLKKLAPEIRAASEELQKTLEPAFGLNQSLQDILAGDAPKATAKGTPSFGQPGFKPGKRSGVQTGISPALREALLDAQINTPEDLSDDLKILQRQRAEVLRKLRLAPNNEERLALKETLRSIVGDISSVTGQIAAGVKQASEARTAAIQKASDKALAEAAKQRAALEKARRAQAAAVQAAQFRALGLTGTGDHPVPTIANLAKQLGQLSGRDDVTPKIEGQLDRIARVLKGKFGKVTTDTRSAIKGLFDAIRDELNKGGDTLSKGPLTKTSSLNANMILAGLGLDPDAERALRARLSTFNSAGRGLPGDRSPNGFFTDPTRNLTVTVVSTLDGEVVARNTTKQQQKTQRRNPKAKRGGV